MFILRKSFPTSSTVWRGDKALAAASPSWSRRRALCLSAFSRLRRRAGVTPTCSVDTLTPNKTNSIIKAFRNICFLNITNLVAVFEIHLACEAWPLPTGKKTLMMRSYHSIDWNSCQLQARWQAKPNVSWTGRRRWVVCGSFAAPPRWMLRHSLQAHPL